MLGYRDWLSFVFAKETIAKIPVEPMSWSIGNLDVEEQRKLQKVNPLEIL